MLDSVRISFTPFGRYVSPFSEYGVLFYVCYEVFGSKKGFLVPLHFWTRVGNDGIGEGREA